MRRLWWMISGGPAAMTAALLLAGASLAGCGGTEGEYVIPDMNTPADQYRLAVETRQQAAGVFDPDAKKQELGKAIAAFEKLESRFPQDEMYTPAASLQIAKLYREVEQPETSLAKFRSLLARYPNDQDIRIEALMGTGLLLDELGRPEEAQEYYRLLIDEFADSDRPAYQTVVEQARRNYRRIRPKAGSRRVRLLPESSSGEWSVD